MENRRVNRWPIARSEAIEHQAKFAHSKVKAVQECENRRKEMSELLGHGGRAA